LLGYDFATATSFLWQLWDYSGDLFFSGNKRRIESGHFLTTGQVEGLCFRTDRYGYVCNEITDDVIPGRLYSFGPGLNLLSPVSDLKQNPTATWCARLPNPATAGQLLDFLNLHTTDNLAEIWDSQGRLFWQSGTRGPVAATAFPPGVYFLQVRELSGIPVCRRAVFIR